MVALAWALIAHSTSATASTIDATWVGGSGLFSDAAGWIFSDPPASAIVPSNDGVDSFRILIDADPAMASELILEGVARVDAVTVRAGDRFVLRGGWLELAANTSVPGTGVIRNDGVIAFDPSTGANQLQLLGAASLEGTGVLDLGDSASSRIDALNSYQDLWNREGHTIRGAAEIRGLHELRNQGTILADGANAFVVHSWTSNEGSLVAAGSGGLRFWRGLSNQGEVVVESGSELQVLNWFSSSGTMTFEDASNAQLPAGWNTGRVEIGDADIVVGGRWREYGTTRLRDGAVMRFDTPAYAQPERLFVARGHIELDAGARIETSLVEVEDGGVVAGTGRITRADAAAPLAVHVREEGRIAPGHAGTGSLWLEGLVVFEDGGVLDIELGSGPDGDRLIASAVRFEAGSRIEWTALDGLTIERGIVRTLVNAGSVEIEGPSGVLIVGPSQGDDLFVFAEAFGSDLVLSAKAPVTATWTGGNGSYSDPGSWVFDEPVLPRASPFPTNDSSSLYHVWIDRDLATDSHVSLGQSVLIESLHIGDGDELDVASGAALNLSGSEERVGSLVVQNDGVLRLGDATGPGTLLAEGSFSLQGRGELVLAADSESWIGPFSAASAVAMYHGRGHTLRGTGTIDVSRLDNAGAIIADGASPLVVTSTVFNHGVLDVLAGAEFETHKSLVNYGRLEVQSGGTLRTGPGLQVRFSSGLSNTEDATLRVGPGALAELRGPFYNSGAVAIDGGVVAAKEYSQSSLTDASIRIGPGGELRVRDRASFWRGGLVLDDGLIEAGVVSAGPDAVVEASGTIRVLDPEGSFYSSSRDFRVAGDGLGLLTVEGNFMLGRSAGLELQLGPGGTGDRLHVTGDMEVEPYARIELSFIEGLAPGHGDVIELLDAGSITATTLADLLVLPALGSDLHIVADIASTADRQILRASTAALVRATWLGGAGSYDDPTGWQLTGSTLASALKVPRSDNFHLFDVSIGDDGSDASVADLASDAAIEALELLAGGELRVAPGAALSLLAKIDRPERGLLHTDGLLQLGDASGGASLLLGRHGGITGSGTIDLGTSGESRIAGVDDGRVRLGLDSGVTIRGAGTIVTEDVSLFGLGLAQGSRIESTAVLPIVFDGGVGSSGTLSALSGGGFAFERRLSSNGLLELAGGAELEMRDFGALSNTGTVRLSGAGTVARLFDVRNDGRFEISDGAVAEVAGTWTQTNSFEGFTRVATGGVLRLAAGETHHFDRGAMELDGGRIEAADTLLVRTSLTGSGSVAVGDVFEMGSGAWVVVGGDGLGRIDVEGDALLSSGRIRLQIGGDVGGHDILTSTTRFEIQYGRLEVELFDGALPERGDTFSLVEAPEIALRAQLEEHIDLPALDDTRFLVPDLLVGSTGAQLIVRTMGQVGASWAGGKGRFDDASSWTFDEPLPAGSSPFPDRDLVNLFRVRIDGDPAADAHVVLDRAVTLESLEIGAGDRLDLLAGSALRMDRSEARRGSGVITNDGLLRLDATAGLAEIVLPGGLVLDGAGEFVLAGVDAQIRALGPRPDMVNEVGHTVRGIGTIDLRDPLRPTSFGILTNAGTLIAEAGGDLVLDAALMNTGLLRIDAGGHLVANGSVGNRGSLELVGGHLEALSTFANGGRVEVRDGGVLSFSTLDAISRSTPELVVGAGGQLRFATSYGRIESGTVSLAGGLLETEGALRLEGALTGFGDVQLGADGVDTLSIHGTVAPGDDAVTGTIAIAGNVSSARGRLLADVAGNDDADRIELSGELALSSQMTVTLSLREDYAPERGDAFRIAQADAITIGGPLADIVRVPETAPGRFLMPQIEQNGDVQQLVVHTRDLVVATWAGGDGRWADASRWQLELAPLPGGESVPSQDFATLYEVAIAASGDAPATLVLDRDVTVDRLVLGRGSTLDVAGDAGLTIAGSSRRPRSGAIVNGGVMRFGAPAAEATAPKGLEATSDLQIAGAGELVLDGGTIRIGTADTLSHTLHNAEGHTLRGAGTIALGGSRYGVGKLQNFGRIVVDGDAPLVVDGSIINEGSLMVSGGGGLVVEGGVGGAGFARVGQGSHADVASWLVAGRLELDGDSRIGALINDGGEIAISAGVVVETDALGSSYFHLDPGLTTLAPGSLLTTTARARLSNGTVRLDDAELRAGLISSARLEGHGRVSGVGVEASTFAPGFDNRLGTLDIEGWIGANALEFDLEGGDSPDNDRLLVGGSAGIPRYARFQVELQGSAIPSRGSRFDLIEAEEIRVEAALRDLVELPTIGPSLFLLPEILDVGTRQILALQTKAPVEARWLGGDGLYVEDQQWAFELPVAAGTGFPTEDSSSLFHVRIGDGTAASRVELDTDVAIESLTLGVGSALNIGDFASLELRGADDRPGSRAIRNDGEIVLGMGDQINEMRVADGSTIDGSGELVMTDTAIRSLAGSVGSLSQGDDHTIRGYGSIRAALHNRGTVVADVASTTLSLASVDNEGTVRAAVAEAALEFGWIHNRGLVELVEGTTLEVTDWREDSSNSGVVIVDGAALALRDFDNRGRVELRSGAALAAGRYDQLAPAENGAAAPLTTIDATSVLSAGSVSIFAGRLLVDGTTITSGQVGTGSEGRIEGSGRLGSDWQHSDVDIRGALAPGRDGEAGVFTLDAELNLYGARALELDVYGSAAEMYDRVLVRDGVWARNGAHVRVTPHGELERGASFAVLEADFIRLDGPFVDLVTTEADGFDTFLVPELVRGETHDTLLLRAKGLVAATWNGGNESGDWDDPSRWKFDQPLPPGSSAVPDDDFANLFVVHVAEGSQDAPVELRRDVAIEALSLGEGTAVRVRGGQRLALESYSTRRTDVQNDGLLVLGDETGGAALATEYDLHLRGDGVVELAGGTTIAPEQRRIAIHNATGHTLRGVGRVTASGGFLNDGHVAASGDGELQVVGAFENRGELAAIEAGKLVIESGIQNFGRIEVAGGGSLRASLVNMGRVEVRDGAEAELFGLAQRTPGEGAAEPSILVEDADLVLRGNYRTYSIADGVLELAGGTVRGDRVSLGVQRAGTLGGTGAIRLDDGSVWVRDAGTLAPGLAGIGRLELAGSGGFAGGRLALDLAGSGDAEYDQLVAGGRLWFRDESRIEVTLQGDFVPRRGDAFRVIEAAEIFLIDAGLALPAIGEDLLLIPELLPTDTGLSLVLGVKKPVVASWRHGHGAYWDPDSWAFDTPLPEGSLGVPSRDPFSLFHVEVSGNKPTDIVLDRDVAVESLDLGKHAALRFASGAELRVTGAEDRAGSLVLHSDGELDASADGGATIVFEGHGTLSGAGRLALGTHGSTRLEAVELLHGAGHTLEGAGTVAAAMLYNDGRIIANTEAALVIDAQTESNGTIEVGGQGSLRFVDALTNRGELAVRDGGFLELARWPARSANEGEIRVEGEGSVLSTNGSAFAQRGRLEIVDGGDFHGSFSQEAIAGAGSASVLPYTRIGGRSTLHGSVSVSAGTFELDGGSILDASSLTVGGVGVLALEGPVVFTRDTGRIRLFGNGVLDPGSQRSVELHVAGGLSAGGGTIRFDVGPGPLAGDRVRVEGDVELEESGVITLRPQGSVSSGDEFALIDADTISLDVEIDELVANPALSKDRYWQAALDEGPTSALVARVVDGVTATWLGGDGHSDDASAWAFSRPLGSSDGFSGNGAGQLFQARIEGDGATPARVAIDRSTRLDRLEIGPDAELGVAAQLTITGSAGRTGSRELANDGVITIDAGSSGEIVFTGDGQLSGTGRLELGSVIRSAADRRIYLDHGAGHTLSGAGRIDLGGREGRFHNAGRVEATGMLTIAAEVWSSGELAVASGAQLTMINGLHNSGDVVVTAGTLAGRSLYHDAGVVRVDGVGALLDVDSMYHEAQLEIANGARAEVPYFRQGMTRGISSDPSTYIAADSELVGSARIERGTFALDGTFTTARDVDLRGSRFEGGGRLVSSHDALRATGQSTIAPGSGGIGTLTLESDLMLGSSASIEIELDAAAVESQRENDLLVVLGSSVLAGTIDLLLLGDPGDFDADQSFDILHAEEIVDDGLRVWSDLAITWAIVETTGLDILRVSFGDLLNANGASAWLEGAPAPTFAVPEPRIGVLLLTGLLMSAVWRPRAAAGSRNTP